MSTARRGVKTHPPTVTVTTDAKTSEQVKYEKMWDIDDYRVVSPGEQSGHLFLQHARPMKDSTCIDFGCGTGRGGLMIALFGNMVVTLVDFAENALDEDVRNACVTQPTRISWLQADLNKPLPIHAAYGYCTDVMEHIPPDEVDRVLGTILRAAQHVFFQIATEDDVMGERIGESLHLSVNSYAWWLKKLRDHGVAVHWSQNYDDRMCQFYVSNWTKHDDVVVDGRVNTEIEICEQHMRENAKTDYQLIQPHVTQDTEIMMICGGPSLNDFTDEIIELRAKGMPMITTNGTYNWAIANGMNPSMQLMIDAREFNKRFVRPVVDGCKYVLAGQCHPKVFEGLPIDRTYIWHVGLATELSEVLDELYEIWYPCPGGSTVTLRGLLLLRMLGFHKIHMYGFDSCYRDDAHHAYDQPENDFRSKRIPVSVGGRVFMCDGWMYSQAREFIQIIAKFGDEISLNVKGDGLIAHIINTGAEMGALEEDED